VIELANQLRIPIIVAINKIDRVEADVDGVKIDLASQGVNI
jgi:translation initiation factor IF-2